MKADLGMAARSYAIGFGFAVFPCVPDGKEPLTPHGFKDASTDLDAIANWWGRWPLANVAVATGSPGPDVLDVDVKDERNGMELLERVRLAGLLRGAGAKVRTPSGGLHFWFAGSGQSGQSTGGLFKPLELKATGGYVLVPPSHVVDTTYGHEGSYETGWWRASTATIDFAAVRRLLEPPRLLAPKRVPRPTDRTGLTPGDDFNARGDWSDVLVPHGWHYVDTKGSVDYWRRPGKDRGVSATVNALGTDRFHVFTSSTELEQGESFSKFGAFAVLNHGGDHGAAAKELRRLGYGEA